MMILYSKVGKNANAFLRKQIIKHSKKREQKFVKILKNFKKYDITKISNYNKIYFIMNRKLQNNSTNKKFLLVKNERNRYAKRNIEHYNLDSIIRLES